MNLRFDEHGEEWLNLLAAVGGNQVTVYDDSYLGGYINVVLQFTNEETTETKGGALSCCVWIHHPMTDQPYLVVSGEDPNLSIISITDSCVVSLLKGHEQEVKVLESLTLKDGLVLLVSLDVLGVLKVWDVFEEEECLITTKDSICCIMCNPIQNNILLSNGKNLSEIIVEMKKEGIIIKKSEKEFPLNDKIHSICALLHLNDDSFAVQTSSSEVFIVPYDQEQDKELIKVNGNFSKAPSPWGVSQDGEVMIIGDDLGQVHIFQTQDGTSLTCLKAPGRLLSPINACAISSNKAHLLMSVAKGHLCRFENTTLTENPQNTKN